MGVLNTTPRTWASSEIVTAAEMNAEIRDPITTMESAWGTWSPTIAGITIGTGGVITARYNRVGKTIDVFIQVTLGTGGVLTGGPSFTLPVTGLQSPVPWMASGYDSSATFDYLLMARVTTTSVLLRALPGTAGNALVGLGASVPFTWDVGDQLTVTGRYEAA